MKAAAPSTAVLLGAILALAACGTTASPLPSAPASAASEATGQPAALPAVVCAYQPKPFDPSEIDLTGAWAGENGGIYYLRQLGSVVWWNAMSGRDGSAFDLGRDWNYVGRGVIDGLQIGAEWANVPRGTELDNGSVILDIQDDGTGNIEILELSVAAGFRDHVLTPCAPVELQLADYLQTYGGDLTQYEVILTRSACEDLADLETAVTRMLNTAAAGSPEFRAALGYSNAIDERLLALKC